MATRSRLMKLLDDVEQQEFEILSRAIDRLQESLGDPARAQECAELRKVIDRSISTLFSDELPRK